MDNYAERQPFYKQIWMWPVWLLFIILVAWFYMEDLIHETAGIVVMVITLAANVFISLTTLETEIDEAGIRYRMYPFQRKFKHVTWDELEEWEVKQYSALRDFGGWGIRIGRKGVAYNVYGNMGLHLVYRGGKRLMIGTQRPDEIAQVLTRYASSARK